MHFIQCKVTLFSLPENYIVLTILKLIFAYLTQKRKFYLKQEQRAKYKRMKSKRERKEGEEQSIHIQLFPFSLHVINPNHTWGGGVDVEPCD